MKIDKFEAIKYRHEDQSKLLQKMTDLDLRITVSFLTLQVVLGGFLSQLVIEEVAIIGLFLIDFAMSFICAKLLYNSYKRSNRNNQ